MEALRAACAEGRARALPGFGPKTEARLLEACDRWLHRGDEAPPATLLSRALDRAETLKQALLSVSPRVELVGALRRGEETVRELEFALLGELDPALAKLSSLRQVLRVEPEQTAAK